MVKRKLNEKDVPEEVQPVVLPTEEPAPATDDSASDLVSFTNLGLDPRLLQAIIREKYASPTPVQARAIPLALEGKDILARARTGSGKTAAYLLPVLQSVLRRKVARNSPGSSTIALILVPTRELANQVTKVIHSLSAFCSKDVSVVNLTPQITDQAQRALLSSNPDIVVTTPARAATHLASSALNPSQLAHVVIDEADLILSYGYNSDFENILTHLPKGVKTFLASATLTTEVDTLKGLFLRDPVILDLQESEKDAGNVAQYIVKCSEEDKFLLLFALFKLKLLKGKCIIFVADVERCYRTKLYLEQFGIRSCVLNAELPVNCRIHVVEEFNKNIYEIIIASDDQEVVGTEEDSPSPAKKKSKPNKPPKKDYGISRGIDFHNVSCVLNFDLPASSRSYTHRIGRTARAGRSGIALSFVIPTTEYRKNKHLTHPSTASDERVLRRIAKAQHEGALEPYDFDMAKLAGLKYRVESALKAVTPGAIREARIRELRAELLKSEKLKRHLEENPDDARHLRHDTENRAARVQPQLKQVPEYLLGAKTGAMDEIAKPAGGDGWMGIKKGSGNRIRRARERNKARAKGKKVNVLKNFGGRK